MVEGQVANARHQLQQAQCLRVVPPADILNAALFGRGGKQITLGLSQVGRGDATELDAVHDLGQVWVNQ